MFADFNELIQANLRRALWATKADHVFLSTRDDWNGKETDATPEMVALFQDESYEVYSFEEASVVYPNGVCHRDDSDKLGVWVSLGPFSEDEDGATRVGVRMYVNHLVNFQREYTWKPTPEGWVQSGKPTVRLSQ